MNGTLAHPRLNIRTLGTAAVEVDGQPAQWHAEGARTLFFYLFAHPEGRTRAQILDELWGLDEDAASGNRFRVTLHRLRGALGVPGAVRERHGRYALAPEVLAASDVAALHTELARAQASEDLPGRQAAYRRALALYGGDFLPDEEAGWVRDAREEHRAAYVWAALELSRLHCDERDCRGAVDALAGALRADPYVGENHHQKLMTCLSVVEGKYAAIEHYRRFLRFLRDDVGDRAMPETSELAERIKGGEPICRRATTPDVPQGHACPLRLGGRCPVWPPQAQPLS